MSDGNEQSGLPLRDVGVECKNCGSEKRRPDSNRCAACGQFAADPRYAYSELTNTWYRVTEYDDLGDGKIYAKSKERVGREDVPQPWLDAIEGAGSA